ncbi:MAG TPA: FliA/WhiG family RNA polymerase sigma factor [Bryobacteraceae bacterium]|jgi:RNA polymerase sigma factor for flagellar operon FliA|nr:FliA/WhiG family RNA polymerase sigma factor [Bryobacteraceae bacterium]
MYTYQTEEETTAERERLILEHLPQVRLIARRIHERLPDNISLDDLISTGVIGLIAAVDHFDPAQGVQLKTYAEHKIRGAILDSLREMDWAPKNKRRRAKQIEAAINTLEQRLGRAPGEEEIAAELEVGLEEYQQWLFEVHGLTIGSLEFASEDQEGDRLSFIPDSEEKLPSTTLERAELERLLAQAIEQMPKMERTVLSLYYHEEATLREIAEITQMHLSRIAQLKSQGILRLRTYIERRWSAQR